MRIKPVTARIPGWVGLVAVSTAGISLSLFLACSQATATEPRSVTYQFDIPAQSLDESLQALALASQHRLLYSSELVDGKSAPVLKGKYTTEQAVQQLLAGADVDYEVSDGLVIIRPRHARPEHAGPTNTELFLSSLAGTGGSEAGWVKVADAEGTAAPAAGSAPVAEEKPTAQIEEVIVTGSRIARPDFTSSVPIVTETNETIHEAGKVNLETALEQMPQFAGSFDESYNAENSGGGGRATVNLRGLGETRTLVLLDGRRMPPSNGALIANLNDIPIGIVEGVEVISGGASAVYGSDAIAGVVNIKTKQHFTGVEFDANYGAAFGGFGKKYDFSLTGGSDFADGKGHALFSLNYTNRTDVYGAQVPFFRVGGSGAAMPEFTFSPTGSNLPSQAAYNALFAQYGAAPGTVGNTTQIGLNDDGTWYSVNSPFVNYKGILGDPGGNIVILNIGGQLKLQTQQYKLVTAPQNRWVAFSKIDYDLADHLKLYFQGLYSNDKISTQDNYPQLTAGPITIPVTNPFIPAALKPILASRPNPTAPFQFFKRLLDFAPTRFTEYFNTLQVLAGLSGDLPWGGMDWDVYAMHDSTQDTEVQAQRQSGIQAYNLLNAADGGNSICDGGFNPFQGNHSYMSGACQQYLGVDSHNFTRVWSNTVEGTLRGNLFDLPAGTVKYALTATGRHVDFSYSPDSSAVVGDPPPPIGTSGTTQPAAGNISSHEFAAEVLVPLLKGAPLAYAWNVNVAGRESHFDVTGNITTYKLDTDWHVTPAVMFRAGYEHAVRAPNITELFSPATNNVVQLGLPTGGQGDPCDFRGFLRNGPNAAQVAALCVAQGIPASLIGTYAAGSSSTTAVSSGSTALKPERADTYTIGTVLSPRFDSALFQNINLSVDLYSITLKDAVSTTDIRTIFNKCYNVDGSNPTYSAGNSWCQLVDRTTGATGGPPPLRVLTPFLNIAAFKTTGADAQLDWTWRDVGPGRLHLSSAWTYVKSFELQQLPNAPFLNYAGTVTLPVSATTSSATAPAIPRIRVLTTLDYGWSGFDVGLRWRHLASMADQSVVTNPATSVAGVPTYDYLDLLLGYDLNEHLKFTATVTNLSNKDPPIVAGTLGNTQRALYDLLGRTYQVGLRAKL
jgi:iron complex outermembrane receptor protein